MSVRERISTYSLRKDDLEVWLRKKFGDPTITAEVWAPSLAIMSRREAYTRVRAQTH